MHNNYYLDIIKKSAESLGIEIETFSDNWGIALKKGGVTKYIIGYLFPLNDACSSKITNNKNVSSEILSKNNIPNVPHQIVFSSSKLVERKSKNGNLDLFKKCIIDFGFPIVIKKNNSSKGKGVLMAKNEADFEHIVTKMNTTEEAFCICPFRENSKEYRCIVLDGECLLTYEKQIPFLLGNGQHSVINLLSTFIHNNQGSNNNSKPYFDNTLISDFTYIPKLGEKIYLQWQHNRFPGTTYIVTNNMQTQELAIKAATAIGARFVSVDIVESEKYGCEVLEINSSVIIHSLIQGLSNHVVTDIFQLALKKIFE